MATNIAANLMAALTREWQALGLHDIGSGLPGTYSSVIAVTCLSRDIYLAAREQSQGSGFLPNGELDADEASSLRNKIRDQVLFPLLCTGTKPYGSWIWPEQAVSVMHSESVLHSPPIAQKLTWSSDGDRQTILDRVLKIMLLDVQFVKHQATQQDLSRQTPVEPMALSAADHEELASQIKKVVIETSGLDVIAPSSKGTLGAETHLPFGGQLCAQEFLEETPDNVFCFCPDQPDHHIEGRWSFNQLVAEWQSASPDRRKTRGIFPDARKTSSTIPYEACTVRCTCAKCKAGEAYQLKCVPFPFGNGYETILIHQFRREGETWAVILTDYGGHIPVYRLWGAFQGDLTVTGDSEYVVLQETSDDKPGNDSHDANNDGRHSAQQYSQSASPEDPEEYEDDGDDNEFSPISQRKRKRNSKMSQHAQPETKRRKSRKGPSTNDKDPGPLLSTPMDANASKGGLPISQDNKRRPSRDLTKPLQTQPDNDDDEEIPLAKWRIRRGSPATKVSAQQPNPQRRLLASHDSNLAVVYNSACKHVMTQKSAGSGVPVIVTNPQLQEYLKTLELFVKEENEWLFQQLLGLIDDELVKIGAEKVPRA
ncbi:hypothetical protein WHR41_01360 [Cladosporium halotolerans]|uniref:Uncharacterized protein n=1 Tax=Cladosporium halotolerans TaxID=1052096 RepID=A0AB34KYV9_9PEZI